MSRRKRIWSRAELQPLLAQVVNDTIVECSVPDDDDHRRRLTRALLRIAAARWQEGGGEAEGFFAMSAEAFLMERLDETDGPVFVVLDGGLPE